MTEEQAQNFVADMIANRCGLDREVEHRFIGELTLRVLAALGRQAITGVDIEVVDIEQAVRTYAVRPAEIRRRAREDCARAGQEMLSE